MILRNKRQCMYRAGRRGAVLLLTLFLILLTSFALSRFIERAYSEILAEAVFLERDRLRVEAYSALEATLAVLFDIRSIDGAVHGPGQGWSEPLDYAGIQVPQGMDIDVRFEDEMGKIPLPTADLMQLQRLFEYLGFEGRQAEDLADSLMGWVNQGHQETSFAASHLEYERAELPYRAPHRPMRTLYELAAIDGFREWFFDEQAVPNELFHQMASLVSLYHFTEVNVNSASPAVLHIWSEFGEHELTGMDRGFAGGAGGREGGAPLFFQNLEEASAHYQLPFNSQQHTAQTVCLRINITIREGVGEFHLSTVVAISGPGAGQLQPGGEIQQRPQSVGRRPPVAADGARAVPYPFRFLEVRENEAIL